MSYVTQFNNLPQGEDYYTVGYDFFRSNPQYLKDYWSIFLNYLKNEDNNQQGLENSQFTSSSLFAYIASQIDFPNNSFIDTVNKNGIIDIRVECQGKELKFKTKEVVSDSIKKQIEITIQKMRNAENSQNISNYGVYFLQPKLTILICKVLFNTPPKR